MREPSLQAEAYFAGRYAFDPGRTRVWRAIAEHLQRYVPEGATVCELGAGYADLVNQLRAPRKYAVDRFEGTARYCAAGVTFLLGDVSRLALADDSIDVLFASNLLEHLAEECLSATMDEIVRTLRQGGRLVIVQPNYPYCYRRYWDDFTHVKAWSHESLPDYLRSRGLEVERVEPRCLPLSFKGRLPRSYWLTRLYLGLPWRPLAAQMLVVARKAGTRA